ncbi:biotin--[acetyl-CoA-carboxylase] ligase [Niabella insulamsoli]|uniref:biotin--[acetyl-CoA-carboxylase] ligase n=1 Tax=Niabella insulamsoli TaxID=3144874 RepID=UPI0031FD10C5
MAQQSVDNWAFPPIIELLTIDSTNNYALTLLKEMNLTSRQEIKHGAAVFAHDQFAGKGQRGKTWHSKAGENIHLSIIIDPKKIGLQRQFLLSAIVSLAVRRFFEKYAQSDISIKWPNDIFFRDRKAGGILIENLISGADWKWAVVGIGLNINQVAFASVTDRQPVSLRQITGKQFDCLALAEELRNDVMCFFEKTVSETSAQTLMENYNQFLYKKGETACFEKDGERFEAIVKAVLPSGQLVLQTDMDLPFEFGEINWVL